MDERKLELIGIGRKAELLLGEFGAYLDLAKDKKLKELKMAYKTGKTDAVNLSSLLAGYCALDDLASELARDVKTANSKSREIMNGSGSDNSA